MNRKWKKYTICTTVPAEEPILAMLDSLGISGVEIEDGMTSFDAEPAEAFAEFPGSEGAAFLHYYVRPGGPEDTSPETTPAGEPASDTLDDSYTIHDRTWTEEELSELEQKVRHGLQELRSILDIGEGTVLTGETEETDWRDNWKAYFQPSLIGKILVIPGWMEVPAEFRDAVSDGSLTQVFLDPGTTFGTGSHETTRLCIPSLCDAVFPGAKVLDVGTGSGILAMAAAKSGAGQVEAIDTDPDCEAVVKGNLEKNGIGNVHVSTGNLLEDRSTYERVKAAGPYDAAAANILAPVIISLAGKGMVDDLLVPGGVFVVSGILTEWEDRVKEAFRANDSWEIREIRHLGEWTGMTVGKKKR